MASVLECLRTQEIARLRLGIAPLDPAPPADLDRVEFVLARFAPGEQAVADGQVARAVEACESWLTAGVAAAMNRFNRDPEATAT
jgi:peptidyl-tRNA hydrolase